MCGGLNKNEHHKLVRVDSVGRSVWKELGSMTLLEEVCHWLHVLRLEKTVSGTMPSFNHHNSRTQKPNAAFSFISCLGHGIVTQQ